MLRTPISISLTVLLFMTAAVLSAQSTDTQWTYQLSGVFPELGFSDLRTLRSDRELTNHYDASLELTYAPDLEKWQEHETRLKAFGPAIGVEALFFLPLPERTLRVENFELRLYNILRSISTMQGVEYYSASRDRMRTLYHESYVVEGPEGNNRTADPVVQEIPQESIIYAFQRDSSFGRNTYEVRYEYARGVFYLSMQNLTQMYYGILPVVGKENLQMHIAVVPTEEGLAFYGNSGVDVSTLFGLADRAQRSFYNRIKAIFGWLSSRMKSEFGI